jgi:hypothetical protein
MLRCLIPAASCVLDVTFALNGAASADSSPALSAVMLGLAVAGAVPLLITASRFVVGVHLPDALEVVPRDV